jgi:hypothetical protein
MDESNYTPVNFKSSCTDNGASAAVIRQPIRKSLDYEFELVALWTEKLRAKVSEVLMP